MAQRQVLRATARICRYLVALDAVPSQFCVGELEAAIVEAFENEKPDVIIIEGQGVVLQHAPARDHRCDFEQMTMPTPASEINLLETFASTEVIGLTINLDKIYHNAHELLPRLAERGI